MTGPKVRTLRLTEEGRKAVILEDMRELGWEVVVWEDGKKA